MSIKVRLIVSYLAMLIIPIILTVGVTLVFIETSIGSIHNIATLGETENSLILEGTKLFAGIKLTADKNPDQLKDAKYLAQLEQKLTLINSGIVVRENNRVIHASKLFDGENVGRHLSKFKYHHEENQDPEFIGGHLYLTKQHDFRFSNGQPATVFLLTGVGPIGQFAYKLIITIGVAFLLIILFTNGILTYAVSRSIIKPLKSLKKAAEQIKEGNLNFVMDPYPKDEIGELAGAFEGMQHQLKTSVEQQMQYENNRKELISTISHDLKTPITAIKGYVEGIMDGVADSPEKMERYIKTIYVKANDLDELIDQLFLFSKLDLKKIPFNFEEIDINSYLADCTEEMQFDLERSGVSVDFHNGVQGPVHVIADREKLKRVITNVIENAVKYMNRESGQIDIYLTADNSMVTVQMQDNGQGIPAGIIPFIFDTFYRADASRNSSTGGSGLGLAISKRIVEEHGGKIWAESVENKGTSIFFTLKRTEAAYEGPSN